MKLLPAFYPLFYGMIVLLVACQPAIVPSKLEIYAVKSGDTLYSIAFRENLNYQALADYNKIQPPYFIYEGQQLTINRQTMSLKHTSPDVLPPAHLAPEARREVSPPAAVRAAPPKLSNWFMPVVPPSTQNLPPKSRLQTPPKKLVLSAPKPSFDVKQWVWPITHPKKVAKGLLVNALHIEGVKNSEVLAANGGTVVYAGSATGQYGKVVIIRHDNEYLSAYGYLGKIFIRQGEAVKRGQVIARVGSEKGNRYRIYFEIRQGGNVVDARHYLPQ